MMFLLAEKNKNEIKTDDYINAIVDPTRCIFSMIRQRTVHLRRA
jgi:hypothetical protein